MGDKNFGDLNHTGELIQVDHCVQCLLRVGRIPSRLTPTGISTSWWYTAGALWLQAFWPSRISWFLTPRAWDSWYQNDLHESPANHKENSLLTWAISSVPEAVWQELFCFVWDPRKGFGRESGQCVPLPVRVTSTKGGRIHVEGSVMDIWKSPCLWLSTAVLWGSLGKASLQSTTAGQKSVYLNLSYVLPRQQRRWHVTWNVSHGKQRNTETKLDESRKFIRTERSCWTQFDSI